MLGQQPADHTDRAGFGHPPPLAALGAQVLLDARQHRPGRGRPADPGPLQPDLARVDLRVLVEVGEQHHPHGRHALHDGDAFVLQKLVHALAVEVRSGQNELGAHHRRRIRCAPGIRVEHRDDQEQRGSAVDVERVPRQRQHRVQHRRTVRVENTFRVPGGARGVTQRRCTAFVELGPVVTGGLPADHVIPAQ